MHSPGRVTRPGQVVKQYPLWHVPHGMWKGETVYIVGGGPSFLAVDPERLRGRRVIALNRSFETVPFADVLLLADNRLFTDSDIRPGILSFKGQVIGLYPDYKDQDPRFAIMRRVKPPGFSDRRDTLTCSCTIMTAGIDFAQKAGAARLVLFGADGKKDKKGRAHHHREYTRWALIESRWAAHRIALETLVEPLKIRGIEVLNASPGSAWPIWPIVNPDDVLPPLGATAP